MTAIDIATARKVLQVPKDATKKDIEKAFRNLSKKLHPDKLSDAKRTAEANERFAEAFNAKDLLLRYLQHLEEEGKVLSSSSCSNVPNADPPIPRKKDRQSASRSAPRDKENKPYSAPYSAEEERKQEDEFKEAWRKVAEMLAREKGVPYENPLKEALPKAREKSKKPSTAAPSKKGVQVPSEKVAAAPFKNGTVKDNLQPQKKPVKKARIIEDVKDSLPHPKKPVKRRIVVEDEDSSDGSYCTSSKSYINSCATGGTKGGGEGNGRAQAPSSNSHGSSRGGSHGNNNSSNGWGGNGGWGYGGPPYTPPPGGGGRNNDGSGGNRGYPSSGNRPSSEWDSNKRKNPGFPNSDANSKRWKSSTTPPLVFSPARRVPNKWDNGTGWGKEKVSASGNSWFVDTSPYSAPLVPPLPDDHRKQPSLAPVPIDEALRDKIYKQLEMVVGTDRSQLDSYVPKEILSLKDDQEKKEWDAKKDAAVKFAIDCVTKRIKQNGGDKSDVDDISDFLTCLGGNNHVYDFGFRVDYGNNFRKCLCPCW
jgi:curved DNA-binding protein CbpA